MVVSVNEELREQTRAAYDAVASDYATIVPDTSFEAPLDLAMVDEFVSEVAKRPASKVLDAGCGAGRMVTYLHSQSPSLDVVGIDLSAEMIALAQSAHPTAKFRRADLRTLDFRRVSSTAFLPGIRSSTPSRNSSPRSLLSSREFSDLRG